jgi:hypothetical protein
MKAWHMASSTAVASALVELMSMANSGKELRGLRRLEPAPRFSIPICAQLTRRRHRMQPRRVRVARPPHSSSASAQLHPEVGMICATVPASCVLMNRTLPRGPRRAVRDLGLMRVRAVEPLVPAGLRRCGRPPRGCSLSVELACVAFWYTSSPSTSSPAGAGAGAGLRP